MTSKAIIIILVIWLTVLSMACGFLLSQKSSQIDHSDDHSQMRIMAQQYGILMVRLDRMEALFEKMLSDTAEHAIENDIQETQPSAATSKTTTSSPSIFDRITDVLLSDRKLPTCNSSTAERMVKGAVKNGPMSKILNLEVLALRDITTKSTSDDKVACHAQGITNAGKMKLDFTFEWANKDKLEYIVQVAESL